MLILDKDNVQNVLFFNYYNLDGFEPEYYLLYLQNRFTLQEHYFLIPKVDVTINYLRSISFNLAEVDVDSIVNTNTHYDYSLYFITDETNIGNLPQLKLDNIDNVYDFGLLFLRGTDSTLIDKVYI